MITLYTLAGTAGTDPTAGFHTHIAKVLVAENPLLWEWYPVDFYPGFRRKTDIPLNGDDTFNFSADLATMEGSASRAFRIVHDHVMSNPNPFVFIGESQGSWIINMMYEEFRNPAGVFHSKYPQWKTAICFGSPRRPRGRTLTAACLAASGYTTADLLDPLGQGACGDRLYPTSFGTVPGIMANPPTNGEIQFFCNQNDAASDSYAMLNANVQDAVGAIARWAWQGTVQTLVSVGMQFLELAGHLSINELVSLKKAIAQWWPFTGFLPDWLAGPDLPNPHQIYDFEPGAESPKNVGPYTSIVGTTLSGCEIAINYLRTLAGSEWGPPVAPPAVASGVSWWATLPTVTVPLAPDSWSASAVVSATSAPATIVMTAPADASGQVRPRVTADAVATIIINATASVSGAVYPHAHLSAPATIAMTAPASAAGGAYPKYPTAANATITMLATADLARAFTVAAAATAAITATATTVAATAAAATTPLTGTGTLSPAVDAPMTVLDMSGPADAGAAADGDAVFPDFTGAAATNPRGFPLTFPWLFGQDNYLVVATAPATILIFADADAIGGDNIAGATFTLEGSADAAGAADGDGVFTLTDPGTSTSQFPFTFPVVFVEPDRELTADAHAVLSAAADIIAAVDADADIILNDSGAGASVFPFTFPTTFTPSA